MTTSMRQQQHIAEAALRVLAATAAHGFRSRRPARLHALAVLGRRMLAPRMPALPVRTVARRRAA